MRLAKSPVFSVLAGILQSQQPIAFRIPGNCHKPAIALVDKLKIPAILGMNY
jgi:hypothetical protein